MVTSTLERPAMTRLPQNRQYLADRYAGMACLLNGKLAKVCGRLNPCASVCTLDGGESHEWSWETVAEVMTRLEGKFRT
jgi:hypothetical protein